MKLSGAGFLLVTGVLTCLGTTAQQPLAKDLFSKFPARLSFTGKPALPVLNSSGKRLFRTRIREGVAAGVVFADHYSVPIWGCGSGCLEFAIVDAVTGSVYMFPFSVSANREEGEQLTFHRNSRAMHIIGSLNEKDSADRWYVWNGHTLVLLSTQPAKLIPDDFQ